MYTIKMCVAFARAISKYLNFIHIHTRSEKEEERPIYPLYVYTYIPAAYIRHTNATRQTEHDRASQNACSQCRSNRMRFTDLALQYKHSTTQHSSAQLSTVLYTLSLSHSSHTWKSIGTAATVITTATTTTIAHFVYVCIAHKRAQNSLYSYGVIRSN